MGDFVVEIVTTVAISIILPSAFLICYYLMRREEKKYCADNLTKTRESKALMWVILGFAIICLVAMIILVAFMIADEDSVSAIVVIAVLSLFSCLGFFAVIWGRFTYEIIEDDGITLVRFGKRRKVLYSDIEYFRFIEGARGGFYAYDKYGVLITSASNKIGSRQLVSAMHQNRVTEVFNGFPTPEMRKTKEYKDRAKKNSVGVLAWVTFFIGVLYLAGWGLVFGINREPCEFENYEVTGIVESYELENGRYTNLTIKLADDGSVYYVNHIVSDELDLSVQKALKGNPEIKLLIAFKDDRERLNISQIEIDGAIYLSAADAEKEEIDNYNFGVILTWVFFGISAVSLATWAGSLIYKKVKFDDKEMEDGRKEL